MLLMLLQVMSDVIDVVASHVPQHYIVIARHVSRTAGRT